MAKLALYDGIAGRRHALAVALDRPPRPGGTGRLRVVPVDVVDVGAAVLEPAEPGVHIVASFGSGPDTDVVGLVLDLGEAARLRDALDHALRAVGVSPAAGDS